MPRVDRVMDLVELLRARPELRVAEVAEELGVSARTVRRDLASLRARGMAISAQHGAGGGIRLERDQGASLVRFAEDEIVALWLTAHLARVATGLPWGKAARRGLDRLFACVPRERAKELHRVCRRVVVGAPASNAVREGAGSPPAELVACFEQAFRAHACLVFGYRDRHGARSERLVEPHGLLVEPPVWYLLALDVDKALPRSFRMDRIERPRLDATRRFRPDLRVVRELAAHAL